MPTQLIDQLQSRIEQQLAVDVTLFFDAGVAGTPNLAQLLNTVLAVPNIALTESRVTVEDTLITVTGKASLLSPTEIPIRIELKDSAGKLQVKIVWDDTLRLSDVAQQLLGGAFTVPDQLRGLRLVSVELPVADESATITAQTTDPLELGAGRVALGPPLTLQLEASNIFEPSLTISGHLQSDLTIAGHTLGITGVFKAGEEADADFQIQPGLDSLSELVSKLLVPNQ